MAKTAQEVFSEKSSKKININEERISYLERLHKITHLIHAADNLDEILLHIKDSILSLFDAERITIYIVDKLKNEIYSKIKTGAVPTEIRVTINKQSIVGYVASTGASLSINDAYNASELKAIYPDLQFDQSWDKRTGYRTRQILAQPLMYERSLVGVIQIINKKSDDNITQQDRRSLQEIAEVLGLAFYNYQKRMVQYKNKFDYLLIQNLITRSDLKKAIEESRESKSDILEILLNVYKINKSDIGKSLSAYFHVKFFEYDDSYNPPKGLLDYVNMKNPAKFMRYNGWVPYKQENERILIICEDPANESKISDIQRLMGNIQFDFMVGLRRDIVRLIDKITGTAIETVEKIDSIPENKKVAPSPDETDEYDSGIIKFVNKMVLDAYNEGASDIHIETYPGKQNTIIRFRKDGDCYNYQEIPHEWKKALISRIKIISNLNIAERRLPQDGKIKFRHGKKSIELRVVTVPTFGGNEDAVLRILAAQEALPVNKLNLSPFNKNCFLDVLKKPYGIFLVAGPTGSGKTTTLHSALGHINRPERKIWTVEDPVEITQKGLRQVQVNPAIDFTFTAALRTFLRADPDVIMIGEMRDPETASMGIGASLTGHLVFSTLHTNSASETVTRLIDLGIDPYNFADALIGILAQRLVKTLCPSCKGKCHPDSKNIDDIIKEYGKEAWLEIKDSVDFNSMRIPKGCSKCNFTGFKGRTGLHEMLVINPEIKRLIQRKATVDEIRDSAIKHGMKTLKQDGIWKVLRGDTTIEKVRSVCSI